MGMLSSVLYGMIAFQVINKQIRKASSNDSKKTLSFNGKLDVRQNINGRLRIYSDFFKVEEQSHNIAIQLSKVDGIENVGFNSTTGSMLIIYNPEKIKGDLLISAIIRLTGIDNEISNDTSLISKEIRLAHNSLNYGILEKTRGIVDINTMIPMIFILLAIREYMRTKSLGTPKPITLLYWAYNTLGLGRPVI